MDRYRLIFLETVRPHFAQLRRTTKSKECIRTGGNHNDLDSVGKDSYHHTIFEILPKCIGSGRRG